MRLRYSPRARDDLASIYSYLAKRSPTGAVDVMTAIYAAIAFIRRRPDAAPTAFARHLPGFAGEGREGVLRVKIVQKYSFKIFYRVVENGDTVEIVHVRHMAQRPWSGE